MNLIPARIIQTAVSLLLFHYTIPCTQVPTETDKEPRSIPQLAEAAKIDGQIVETVWQQSLALELAYETQPGENIPALVRTLIWTYHDRQNLYFAIKAFDPEPHRIRCRLAQRDQIGNDDLININLDTFNDERRNYYLGCNPLGVQRDGVETVPSDGSWDAIWTSAGRITADGYEIEMAIPFSSIRFQKTEKEQIWGLDISRWYQREYMHRLGLVPIERGNNSYQSQFLKIIGFSGIKPGKNIEIVPTLTASRTENRELEPVGPWIKQDSAIEPGVSASWGLTPNLVVSGTVNPDFSQVEADSRQLDVNEPFAIFFAEKRPFFCEGADFFKSSFNVLHTRTLRDPGLGLKLSGKEGSHTIGAYLVQDTLTNLIFPGSQGSRQTSLNMDNTAVVLRYKKDFGPRYTLGAYLTNRQGDEYHNRVVGADGSLRFNPQNRLDFQFLASQTDYPDELERRFSQPEGGFSDWAGLIEYQYQSRSLHGGLGYHRIGTEFRADLGFMPQAGYEHMELNLGRNWYNPKRGGWWSNLQVDYTYWREKELDKTFLKDEHSFSFSLQAIAQSYFFAELESGRERYLDRIHPITTLSINFQLQPFADLTAASSALFGDAIDYTHNRPGRQLGLSLLLDYRLARHIKLSVEQVYERMRVDGMELYTANITQGSLHFHLNPRIMIRGILQYVNTRYNPINYLSETEPRQRDIFSQFLFSYQLNPRTLLYLGYSDSGYGNSVQDLRRAQWSLFLKLSFAWRL